MLNDRTNWRLVFDDFCHTNPRLSDEVVDWYPSGHLEITIKLENENKLVYDYISKTARLLCHSYMDYDDVNYRSEQEFIDEFSWRLVRKIKASGLTGIEVAEKAKITSAQLSKYTTGKALPNSYTLYKLASVLKCNPSELLLVR